MKLLKRHIEKDGSGSVSLRLEYDEDLWHAYNLIQEVHSLSPAQTSSLPHLDDLLTYCREMKCGQQQSGG